MRRKRRLWWMGIILLVSMVSTAYGAEVAEYKTFPRTETISHEIVSVGGDQTSVCVTWFSESNQPQLLFVTPAAEEDVPSHASRLCLVEPRESVYQKLWRFSAQVSGLTSGAEYQYCIAALGQIGHWSAQGQFRFTPEQCREFLLFGDPQLGGSRDRERDQKGFQRTLSAAKEAAPNASFALFMGDLKQTKVLDHREGIKEARKEFSAFKKAVKTLEIPAAIVCGNHDVLEDDRAFLDEFAAPVGQWQTENDEDYSFQAGQTLFLVLNSNRNDPWEHVDFLYDAVEQHPDALWRVVVMHHTLYPMSSDKDKKELSSLKKRLTAVCCELGVQVVFSAHNHFYARTNPLNEEGQASDHGPVYLCLNSSSGSIYLDPWKKALPEKSGVVEVLRQDNRPNYTRCRVDEHSFRMETFDAETGEVVDAVELNREQE